MGRNKKDSRPLNINLQSAIYDRLEEFCEETYQNKTSAIEQILLAYFNQRDNEKVREQRNSK